VASRLKIPKLGMSVNEATISEWLVEDGSQVSAGDPICNLETDKTEVEVPSPVAGTIKIIGAVGETYEVGTIIAELS
jgi:pyruvate/2-oxoglutarate dehydrogenase complex dihydrolipoamide acyltransferase (E2) component